MESDAGRNGRRVRRCRAAAASVLAVSAFASAAASASAQERVLERVTPADAGGYTVWLGGLQGGSWGDPPRPNMVSADGNHLIWTTVGDPEGVASDGGSSIYKLDILGAHRGDRQWSSSWMTSYADRGAPNSGGAEPIMGSEDGSQVLYTSDDHVVPSVPPTHSFQIYIGSAAGNTLISHDSAGLPAPSGIQNAQALVAASSDLRTVAFSSADPLLPDEDSDALSDVYVRRDGAVSLVSRNANGPAGLASGNPSGVAAAENAVTRDGRTIFFSDDDGLSVWRDGSIERIPVAGARFVRATPSGDYVFFTAMSGGADTLELYRYDVQSDAVDMVSGGGAGVPVRYIGVADDGSRAYFVTDEELEAEDADGGESLYVWSAPGAHEYISPIANQDFGFGPGTAWAAFRTSTDGTVAAFTSTLPLTPDDNNGVADVFVYRGDSLQRISAGGDETHPAVLGSVGTFPNWGEATRGRAMTPGGESIFFSTERRLVGGDVNDAVDIYEYTGGTVKLVTPGTLTSDAIYYDSSVDGRDVIFLSNDAVFDGAGGRPFVYDARRGGGFGAGADDTGGGSPSPGPGLAPPATPPATTEPVPFDPPTGVVTPPAPPQTGPSTGGGSSDRLRAPRRRLRLGRNGGQTVVVVPSAGEVTIAVRTARGKRGRTIAQGEQSADERGRTSVPLELTKAGKRWARRNDGVARLVQIARFVPSGDGAPLKAVTPIRVRSARG